MSRWSYHLALNVGLVVIGLLALLSSGAALIASTVLVQDMARLAENEVRDLAESQAVRLIALREVSDGTALVLTGDQKFAIAARAGSAKLRERLDSLEEQIFDPAGKQLVAGIRAAEAEYLAGLERADLVPSGPGRVRAGTALDQRGRTLEHTLDDLVAHMEPALNGGLAVTRSAVRRTQTRFNWITTISILLTLILCLLLLVIVGRSKRLQSSTRLLAEEGQTRSSAALTEARAASQLKDEFLATVSHELRNPLAPILTWTQLLRSGTLDAEKSARGLEVIERNVASLSQLIDDLVDVSRVNSGKFRLDVRQIDLLPVIRAAVESQRPASDAKQIRLQLVLDERAGMISGDSERMQQVMANLLSNAIKFTPKGRTVQVRLERADSHVEVSVADTGIGIEPSFLPHVFEPFQQATDGSMRRHGGLGLGLSIVRHIVELHGGEIHAASQGPDKGSTFTVKLPLLGTAAPRSVPPRHPIAVDGIADVRFRRLDHVRVLLVDDEPTANEALQTLLESCGAQVRVVASAAQAILMLDDWRPDVLISDIAMPEEDGYALIRQIRARASDRGGDVPAAALTAYAKIDDRVRILAAGFQMYLSKPADPSELVAVVASLAGRGRRPDEHGDATPTASRIVISTKVL